MNLGFDSTGIAFDVILWKDILRVLKPGGHVAAFAASRTYHRLACAIEDAGFEIRDQIDWVYASGMPHGSDARLLVDRELGAERTHVAGKGHAGAGYSDTNSFGGSSTANGGKTKSEWDALATEQGEQWSGWYSQLKPAHEPICLARKPLDGTLDHNLLGHGTGALHIDACRIPFRNTADEKESKNKNRHADFNYGWSMTHTGAEYDDAGGASRFYPVFRYCPKAGPGERLTVDGILHPTVKPLELMRCWCVWSRRRTGSCWSRSPAAAPRWRRAGSRTCVAWRRRWIRITCGS